MAARDVYRSQSMIHLLFALAAICTPAAAQVIYVDDDAPAGGDGASWTTAYRYLQDALADANSAQKPIEMRVAQGVYAPDRGADRTPGEREATFRLINGVALYGGYAGFDEADPDANNIYLHETVLTGDLNGDDADISEPASLPDDPNRTENCYHVITAGGTEPNAVVDGFVITGGVANGDERLQQRGGGAYIPSGSPTFRNCRFVRNMANQGGAVNCSAAGTTPYASPAFVNCAFEQNEAVRLTVPRGTSEVTFASFGGAVDVDDRSGPVFFNCAFWENRAQYGGAIDSFDNSASELHNCTLSGNKADFGGAIYNYSDSSATTTITDSILWGNEAAKNEDEILTGSQYPSQTAVSYTCIAGGHTGIGNIGSNPRFVHGPLGEYYLSQRSAGQGIDSPCVDRGSDTASELGLSQLTTRNTQTGDQGIVDMGYHYPKAAAKVDDKKDAEGFETGDFSRFDWILSGDANWTVTPEESYTGQFSAQAGAIGGSQYTALEVTLECVSGDLLFHCRVSSEAGFDSLKLYLDDEMKGEWSGLGSWVSVRVPVAAGTRTFKWVYAKDGTVSRGADTAWIDDIAFPVD